MNKKIILIIIVVLLIILFAFITISDREEEKVNLEIDENIIKLIDEGKYRETENVSNYIKISVRDFGEIIAVLYPDVAPVTVENFKKLISEYFYNGLTFHRVIDNFMIQTGDPTGTGAYGSQETIKGEFSENGFKNILSHSRGVLSMARVGSNPETSETYNSASSQFFIVQTDSTYLDGKYAAFGKVISGITVVDKIASEETDEYDKPINDIIIDNIKFIEISE